MKRVSEKQKRGSVVAGLDPAIGRYLAAGSGARFDPVYFAQSSLVMWLNGFERVDDWIMASHVGEDRAKQKKVLRMLYPDGRIPAKGWSSESRERVLELLNAVRMEMERVLEFVKSPQGKRFSRSEVPLFRAKSPDAPRYSSTDVWCLYSVTALMRRYATYPALIFHPAAGGFGVAHQALSARGKPWDPSFEIVMFMAEDEEREIRRKAALYDKQRLSPVRNLASPANSGDWVPCNADADGFAGVPDVAPGAAGGRRAKDVEDRACAQSLQLGGVPDGEILAAYAVIELARLGKLDQIRHCVCGKWMFARSNKKCCSSNCRHKIYEQKPEYKKKRADDARKNRATRGKGFGAFDADRKARTKPRKTGAVRKVGK